MRAWLLACALAFGVATSERPSFANGRFPRAERLRESPDDPAKLVLAATYGLLVTNDRGTQWRHVCELGYAFSIDDLDPLVELPPDGSLLVTAAHSLNRAEAPFCAFEPVLGGAGTETVVDYALDATARNRVVAALMRSTSDGIVNELYESSDAGRTFVRFGTPLPEADVAFAVTLDVAPSDPSRIYVSAAGRNEPEILVRSDDAGATWTVLPIPVASEEYPYLAAVHPTNPDVVYVRTDRWIANAEGDIVASDGLFVSDDGGRSFRELHRAAGKLYGFALSPDGSELVIGYGDPVEPSRSVDASALGIYRARTDDDTFTKIDSGSVTCLSWTESGLYACTSQAERGFALGLAPNADFSLADANPFTPLLELEAVRGPLECASGSVAACADSWPNDCAIFGTCDGGAAGSGASGTPENPPSEAGDSGCGCRSASEPAPGSIVAAILAVSLLARRRRPLSNERTRPFTRAARPAAHGERPVPRDDGDTRNRGLAPDRS